VLAKDNKRRTHIVGHTRNGLRCFANLYEKLCTFRGIAGSAIEGSERRPRRILTLRISRLCPAWLDD